MKKNLFFLAAAAVALASCSSDETTAVNSAASQANQPREIAFSAFNQSATRTISNTYHGYITNSTFNTGWGLTTAAVDITNNCEFFGATDFHYQYAGGTTNSTANPSYWGGETPRYWPLSETQINFLAIALANDNNSASWTNTKTDNKVVVEFGDNYAYNTKQFDFVYAIGNGEVTKSGNTLNFPEKVDMTFKHTQAYLIFRVKANSAVEASGGEGEITITDIKVKGARTKGKATIARHNPGTYADTNVDLLWEAPSVGTAYPSGGDGTAYNSVTENQTAISYELSTSLEEKGHLLVIPNMSSANNYTEGGFTSFEISYTLDGKNYTYEYTPTTTLLKAGYKYIYDITFKLHEIFVAPSVEEWKTDVNGNAADDDSFIVPIASYSTEYQTNASFTCNEKGQYTVYFTGMSPNQAGLSIVTDNTSEIFKVAPALKAATADGTGVAAVTFSVLEHTTAKSGTITLKISDADKAVITINQDAVTP